MGNAWTADYLKITGELDVDLRSNIAAEARAKIVYERLINFMRRRGHQGRAAVPDDARNHAHEGVHAALESLGKPPFSIGQIPPTPGLVDQFFNDSTGEGDDGEIDARGPWNEGGDWEFVEAPASRTCATAPTERGRRWTIAARARAAEPDDARGACSSKQLRDLLHAEGQLVKALPKMVKAAKSDRPAASRSRSTSRRPESRSSGLKEAFELLGVAARPKPCKGMAGLLEEGNEVIDEGEDKDDVAADLALIAAAQKVEHYEISAYGTARALAGQIGRPGVAALLSKSLAEEEVADNLLTQIARELMGKARTGATRTRPAGRSSGRVIEA